MKGIITSSPENRPVTPPDDDPSGDESWEDMGDVP
jgi:hypothetical protein